MAGSLASINIKFFADLKDFSTKMQTANRTLKKHGKAMTKLGSTLSVGLTAPMAAFAAVSLKNWNDQEKAIAQVNAGLKSTGNAVGYTSEELQKMAADLQNNTLFGDEEILKGATSQLLTFTNITKQQFARTQVAALDLATRLDGDLKSASIQLGKALNDPIANLSALSRSGIQFSTEQTATIKTLAETNRLAEAQTIILNELEKQYGGSAAAAAEAGTGPLKQLSNILGDLSEDFGAIIAEAITPFIAKLKDWAIAFKNLSPATKQVIVVVGLLVAAIGPLLVALGFMMTTVIPGLITAFTFLSTTVLPAVVSGFNSLNTAILANPIGVLAAAVGAIVYGFTVLIQKITPAVSKLKTFFNLVKSGGNHAAFLNYQMADQNEAMDAEARAAEAAAKAQEKFNKEQQNAAIVAANLTAVLKKQPDATTPITSSTSTQKREVNTPITGEATPLFAIPTVSGDLKLASDQVATFQDELTAFQASAQEVGWAVGDAFMQLGSNIVAGLGLAETGFGGFVGGMVETITQLIAMMLSASISQSIAGATASGTATGPAAVFTTPAFIATAVGGVLSAFAAIPKFATGGIVGGDSYYGDKLLALVNSGEAIFNRDQQKTLYNAVGSSNVMQVPYIAESRISGSDIKLSLKRTNKKDARIS
ncbi:phage tail length tape measure family protein [Lutibacter holmesii]|uniref:Phage tail length tape measure family protein n=1 Tax=Lutibacter holmesii TaxID=1137985 RepID=A0ABW3WK03_9FLAO